MTPEAQIIAIAKACGWQIINDSKGIHNIPPGWTIEYYISNGEPFYPRPDYLKDLNEMHEAEKVLATRAQRVSFIGKLCGTVGVKWKPTSHFDTIHATAAQRAEAFLRTLNLWDDSK